MNERWIWLFAACCMAAAAACDDAVPPAPDAGSTRAVGSATTSSAASAPSAAPAAASIKLKPAVPGEAPKNEYSKEQVERGRLFVLQGSCNDCHTPWLYDEALGAAAPDWSRTMSGHPSDAPGPQGTVGPHDIALVGPTFTSFKLPFGVTYSMNLTPDLKTGTGSWTEEMFIGVFRKGRHLGGDGRPVYPPMPWHYLNYMRDDDLRAIFAYLRSLPPIVNQVPEAKVSSELHNSFIEYNKKLIALQEDPKTKLTPPDKPGPRPSFELPPVKPGKGPAPSDDVELVNKGRVMVMAGLCNDCHTPWVYNEGLGAAAPDLSRMLSGHPEGAPDPAGKLGPQDMWIVGPTFTSHTFPFGTIYSMNITPDEETGIGKWTVDQFIDMFRKAKHPDGRPVLPPMPWAMVRHLPDDDLKAIFAYLRSVPPIHNKVPAPKIKADTAPSFEQINAKMLKRKL